MNATFSLTDGFTSSYQYLLAGFRVESYLSPHKASNLASVHGSGRVLSNDFIQPPIVYTKPADYRPTS